MQTAIEEKSEILKDEIRVAKYKLKSVDDIDSKRYIRNYIAYRKKQLKEIQNGPNL